MTYQGPWDRDTTLRPKAVVIFGDAHACPKCRKWHGTYPIKPGRTLEEVLDSLELPPYHPNCNCGYRIEYENSAAYMTEAQLQEVLVAFESIRDHYVAHSRPGPLDNLLLRLPFAKEKEKTDPDNILKDLKERMAKSCGARAGELMVLLKNYLYSRPFGTSGCRFEIGTKYAGLHGFVVFHYCYLDTSNNLQKGSRPFDAWIFKLEEWANWLKDSR